MDETRKMAALFARAWADPELETQYRSNPDAVLAGAGINLAGRAAPAIPEKPGDIAARAGISAEASFSSASSASTVTCPCSAFTASCANCASEATSMIDPVAATRTLVSLAEDPKAREDARKMTSSWGVQLEIRPQA
jgi:hypothetical protein